MSWAGKSVLVTGAGGFIGSHLAERLVESGARTRCLVRYNARGRRGWLDESGMAKDMEIVAGDILDRDSVRRAMDGCEVVFHLAALIGIPYSYHAPASYVQVNIGGTFNVLQSGIELKTPRIVHTSTSEVYGSAQYVPIDEKHPLQAQSPYSATKIGADKLAESFACSFGLPVVTARPFNTFGPRQSERAVIPTIVSQCLRGSEVRLGNTEPRRDLNFVSNTVDAFLAAATSEKAVGRAVHFGSGTDISVGDLARKIGEIMGRDIRIVTETERQRRAGSEVERLLADNRLAQELLGWQPRIPFVEGLKKTIEWIVANRSRYEGGSYVV